MCGPGLLRLAELEREGELMKAAARLWVGGLVCVLLLIVGGAVLLRSSDKRSVKVHSPELEYLKSLA
jgi:hypothetical protein